MSCSALPDHLAFLASSSPLPRDKGRVQAAGEKLMRTLASQEQRCPNSQQILSSLKARVKSPLRFTPRRGGKRISLILHRSGSRQCTVEGLSPQVVGTKSLWNQLKNGNLSGSNFYCLYKEESRPMSREDFNKVVERLYLGRSRETVWNKIAAASSSSS